MFNLELIYDEMFGLKPRRVAEVGVNEPDKCSVASFLRDGIPGMLVEPLPWCAEHLRAEFPNTQVIEGAIGDGKGKVLLYDRGEGSWIADVPDGCAPDEHVGHTGMKRSEFEECYVRPVLSYRWQELDPGDIDILCVDTEGAEWFVVREMQSRPCLVRLEMHFTHSGWRNPYDAQIRGRMADMGYEVLGADVSDVLWARRTL